MGSRPHHALGASAGARQNLLVTPVHGRLQTRRDRSRRKVNRVACGRTRER